MSSSDPTLGSPRHPTAFGNFFDRAGMLLVLALLFIGCALFVDNFLTWRNMQGLALAVTTIGMVSCTMLFCLAAGDFDLSIGSVVACAGVLAAVVMTQTGSIALGSSALLGLPTPVWITSACFIVFGFLLNRTVFGRDTLAVGGNSEAAHLAGIPVERVKIIIFTLQGIMAAFAGIVLASRMTSGQPNAGLGFELEVISACVLGGVSLTGGIGSMGFVIAGVLIMGIVQNAMNLMNVATFYQYIARGLILLAAVLFDRWKRRKQGE